MQTLVIKPCVENPKYIDLRVTEMEGVLYPFMFEQTPENKAISTSMGHAFGDIIQACCHNITDSENADALRAAAYRSASILNNYYLKKFKSLLGLYKESIDDKIRFFVHNLEQGTIINYGLSLYNDTLGTEINLGIRVECGEYKVCLRGSCDVLLELGIADIKYYSKLWEGGDLQKLYTKNNYIYTSLAQKTQRYTYPYLMYGKSQPVQKFVYDVFDKTKKLKHERIFCEVDMERAEEQIKRDIINYFKIQKSNGLL